MKKLILCVALLAVFSVVVSAETIPDSSIFIEKTKITNKQISKLAHRKFDRHIFIKDSGKNKNLLGFLNEAYNVEDSIEDIANQKNKILNLQVASYGIAETPMGKAYHDVASCMFIDRKTGCILYRASDILCVGQWDGIESWKTDEGEMVDFSAIRKSILDRTNADTDLLKRENYSRCEKQ